MTNEEMFFMFGGVILVCAIFIGIIFLVNYLTRKNKTKNCTFPIEGTLVRLDIDSHYSQGTTTTIYTPIFRYVYNGKEYEGKAFHDWFHTAWEWIYQKAGDKFTIYLDENQPTHFVAPPPKVSKELAGNRENSYVREWGKDGVWRDLTPEQKEEEIQAEKKNSIKWAIFMVVFLIVLGILALMFD